MNTEKTDSMNQVMLPGQFLKAERERKQLSTKTIAEALNLPDRFLQYVETGDYDKLPGLTFARGYIRIYAKYLELDNSEELVKLFDEQTEGNVPESKALDFKQIKQIKNISNSIYWLISFILCLVLAGIAFLIWQNYLASDDTPAVDNSTVIVEPNHNPVTTNDPSMVQATLPLNHTTTDNASEQRVEGIPLTEIRNTEDMATNILPEPVQTTQPVAPQVMTSDSNNQTQATPASQPTALQAGEGHVQASFQANCWVTLTDATGKALVNKLFTANESLDVKGKAPLEIVLGAPSSASLTYNGQAVAINVRSGSTHRIKLGQ